MRRLTRKVQVRNGFALQQAAETNPWSSLGTGTGFRAGVRAGQAMCWSGELDVFATYSISYQTRKVQVKNGFCLAAGCRLTPGVPWAPALGLWLGLGARAGQAG